MTQLMTSRTSQILLHNVKKQKINSTTVFKKLFSAAKMLPVMRYFTYACLHLSLKIFKQNKNEFTVFEFTANFALCHF